MADRTISATISANVSDFITKTGEAAAATENMGQRMGDAVERVRPRVAALQNFFENAYSSSAQEATRMSKELADAIGGVGQQAETTKGFFSSLAGQITEGILGAEGLRKGFEYLKEGLASITTGAAEWGEKLKDMSLSSGISVDALQRLQYAAKITSTPFEALTGFTNRFASVAQDVATGASPKLQTALDALGVTAEGLRDPFTALLQIEDTVKKAGGWTEELRGSLRELGGRGALILIPLIDKLRELSAEAERTGNIVGQEGVDKLDKAAEGVNRLSTAWGRLSHSIGEVAAGPMASFLDILNEIVSPDKDAEIAAIEKRLQQLGGAALTAYERQRLAEHAAALGAGGVGGNSEPIAENETAAPDAAEAATKASVAARIDDEKGFTRGVEREIAERSRSAYEDARKAVEDARRAHEQMLAEARAASAGEQAVDQAYFQNQKAMLDQKRAAGQITEQQEAQALIAFENFRFQAELDEINKEIQLEQIGTAAYTTELRRREVLTLQHSTRLINLQTAAAKPLEMTWKSAATSIENTFSRLTNSLLSGTETIGSAFLQMGLSLGESLAGNAVKAGFNALFGLFNKQVLADASVAYANTYAAISAIPVVGPYIAPPIAGAAYAAVIAVGAGIPSAEGGWDDTRAGMTMIHAHEMILTADIAEGLREMVRGGGAGNRGGGPVHISAMDSRDVARAIRGPLGRELERWNRNFGPLRRR